MLLLCNSYFSPILWNGFTTVLKRTWNEGKTKAEQRMLYGAFLIGVILLK